MKILLINLSELRKDSVGFPLGILSLATVLKSKGYDTEVIDFNQLYNSGVIGHSNDIYESIDQVCRYILNFNPAIVGFYTMCNSYHNIISVTKKLKEMKSDIKILLGGPQASLTAEASMEAFPWIDAIGVGEGELTIEYIIDSLLYNKPFDNVNGVAFRKGDLIFCNENSCIIKDLDTLPFIDYSQIDLKNMKYISIDVGRGCPFGCTYCSTKTFWKRNYRLKSPKRIIEEIKYLKSTYNICNFNFVHDLFTVNRKKILEFCDSVIKENLNIQWVCSARVDTLDEVLIKRMKLAGCRTIYLGIETGSQRMQKLINKNLELSNIWDTIDCLKKNGIHITLSFIYGFPNETISDLKDTLDAISIAYEKKVNTIQLHLLTILPGTEMFNDMKNKLEYGEIQSDISDCKNIEYCSDIIYENPDIFPQYYNFKTEIRERFKYLDSFINYYIKLLTQKLPATYKMLMRYYNDNLLDFFEDFKGENLEYFEQMFLSDKRFKSNYLFLQSFNVLRKYINNTDFKEMKDLIRDTFESEIKKT